MLTAILHNLSAPTENIHKTWLYFLKLTVLYIFGVGRNVSWLFEWSRAKFLVLLPHTAQEEADCGIRCGVGVKCQIKPCSQSLWKTETGLIHHNPYTNKLLLHCNITYAANWIWLCLWRPVVLICPQKVLPFWGIVRSCCIIRIPLLYNSQCGQAKLGRNNVWSLGTFPVGQVFRWHNCCREGAIISLYGYK